MTAHAQKPDFVFRRNGRVHLNRRRASVQSTTGSRGVRISGSNAGYTMFRGSVKSIGYPLHSPVSPSLPLPCVTVCHHISTGLYRIKYLYYWRRFDSGSAGFKHRWGNNCAHTVFVVFFSNCRQISGKYLGYVTANSKLVVVQAGGRRTLALDRAGTGIDNWAEKLKYIKIKSAPT